jgi:hypothetical protein
VTLVVDHVVLAVPTLDLAPELFAQHGLASYQGGVHRGWGTANVIAPLGNSYLEAIGVVDREEAAHSVFGRWLASTLARRQRFMGWCVRTDDIEGVARRVGRSVDPGSRLRTDGQELRTVGSERALYDPSMPFFIQWDVDGDFHPGHAGEGDLVHVEVAGDVSRIADWLGDDVPNVTIVRGEPEVRNVVVRSRSGETVVGASVAILR